MCARTYVQYLPSALLSSLCYLLLVIVVVVVAVVECVAIPRPPLTGPAPTYR